MRARRAERCLQRAATAIDDGSVPEARDALDEARQLSPADPRIQELDVRLDALNQLLASPPLESVGESSVDSVDADDLRPLGPPSIDDPVRLRSPEPSQPVAATFEPAGVLGLDTFRAPSLEGWSGVAVAPSPRQRTRSAGVLAIGLTLVTLAGWQAWTHKEQWTAVIPNSQPDVDADTGLAARTPSPEPIPPSIAPNSTPAAPVTRAPAQSDPIPQSQAMPSSGREVSDAERASASSPLARGTTGSDAPRGAEPPGTRPAQSAVLTESGRERAVAPAVENRPPATPDTLATSAPDSTRPAPTAPQPSTLDTTPSIPSVVVPAASTPSRTEPVASLPSPPVRERDPEPAVGSAVPSTASSSPTTVAPRDQSVAIRAALNRYEAAYNRLDATAVQSVWPSLDRNALSRAFDGLASQKVSLGNCSVNVRDSAARAYCAGTTAWTPKVGGGARTASRKWTFDLSEADGTWRIVRVEAR